MIFLLDDFSLELQEAEVEDPVGVSMRIVNGKPVEHKDKHPWQVYFQVRNKDKNTFHRCTLRWEKETETPFIGVFSGEI